MLILGQIVVYILPDDNAHLGDLLSLAGEELGLLVLGLGADGVPPEQVLHELHGLGDPLLRVGGQRAVVRLPDDDQLLL